MSSEKFEWQFNLINNMSGPASAATRSLTQLNTALNQVNIVNINLRTSLGQTATRTESWVTTLRSSLGVLGAVKDRVMDVTGALAGLTRGFVGAVIEQAKFHSRSMTTLGSLLRNEPGGARREFSAGIRLAQGLPGSTEDVLNARVGLAGAGFRDRDQRDRMHALLSDLTAMSFNQDAGTQQRALLAIGQIQSAGRLRGQEVNQLTELNTGVGRGDLFREIAAGRGLRGSPAQLSAQVEQLMHDRQIGSAEALSALQRAVVAVTGKQLGGFAHEQGSGLLGQMSNFESLPQTVLQSWFSRQESTMSSGGMTAFGNFLQKVNGYFAEGTPTGERFMALLDKLINDVFGKLFGNDPTQIFDKIVATFERWEPRIVELIGMFPKLIDFLTDLLPLVEKVGVAFDVWQTVVKFTVGWFNSLVAVKDAVLSFLQPIIDFFKSVGGHLISGIVTSVEGNIGQIRRTMQRVTGATTGQVQDDLQIHSPSRVMMGFGRYISEGLALGIDSGAPRVSNSMGELFTPSTTLGELRPQTQGATVSHGAVQLTINFALPEGATDAHAIADAARPMIETALAECLERMAVSAGAG